jgi:DNA end-binding protein Ku
MAPRSYWKGYLKLSLVSCPVSLYSATSESEKIKFNQLNKATGNRVKQQLVDGETGKTVEREDIVKGYEHDKGQYLQVTEAELEAVKLESTHTIEIVSFVPKSEVSDLYLDGHYFMTPSDKVGVDAFAIIRDSMRAKDLVGIGRVVLGKRERIVMLSPSENGMAATTLRYDYEVRKAADYYTGIPETKAAPEMLELASHMIDKMTSGFDATKFEDRYENGVLEILKRKQSGMAIDTATEEAKPKSAIDLMAALRASVEGMGNVVLIADAPGAKTKAAAAPATKAEKTESTDNRKRKKTSKAVPGGPGDEVQEEPSPAVSGKMSA